MNFSTFATSLLQSTSIRAGHSAADQPLFYSTLTRPPDRPAAGRLVEDDILGDSYEDERPNGLDEIEGDDVESRSDSRSAARSTLDHHEPREPLTSALGLSSVVPAFVTRLGTATGVRSSRSGAPRGWKAYESVAATYHLDRNTELEDSDLSDSDQDDRDEGPLPGTFVSKVAASPDQLHTPLMGRQTLFVYPSTMSNSIAGVNAPARELYRDSAWIVLYGLSLGITLGISVKAYLTTPPTNPSSPYPSLISTTPVFVMLSLLSLFTSFLALVLLLVLRRALRPLLTLAIFVGPFLFCLVGVIAFFGSFGERGVARDAGWRTGMRLFALGCIVMSWVLGRVGIRRRAELNRAVLVGELACQTIMHHPPLVLLSLVLSFVSTLLSLPFVALVTSLLSLSHNQPKLASYGSTFAIFSYVWTLAVLRGIGKATTSGVVGSWYFEGQSEQHEQGDNGDFRLSPGPVQVTQAAFARATGPSLGTLIFTSLLTTLLQTLSAALRTLSRVLRSANLPQILSPLTYLIPICDFLSGWTNWFNGYTAVYVGLTGKAAKESARDVAAALFANRAANIRDATLLRLLLNLALYPLTLLPSLVTFLVISTSYLSPNSGGYGATLAVLAVVVPAWTGRVVLGLVTDAVDTLFLATHLDAENEVRSCKKAVQAFEEPERDPLAASLA
ncbi:uncharacterized protein JCM15063_005233 [Sporobolomyces koalae]|uniref:uncharacterized protein n=1 Tax=Sporobolomyces koalae TaxID=500713 RepID=UPI0031706F3D